MPAYGSSGAPTRRAAAGAGVGAARVGRVGAADALGGGRGVGDGPLHLARVRAQYGGEDLAQRRLLGVGAQQIGVRLEAVDAEAFEELGGFLGCAEAAQTVERRERADQFGLVVGVLVVAVRGVDRDAALLLVLVTLLRLLE